MNIELLKDAGFLIKRKQEYLQTCENPRQKKMIEMEISIINQLTDFLEANIDLPFFYKSLVTTMEEERKINKYFENVATACAFRCQITSDKTEQFILWECLNDPMKVIANVKIYLTALDDEIKWKRWLKNTIAHTEDGVLKTKYQQLLDI